MITTTNILLVNQANTAILTLNNYKRFNQFQILNLANLMSIDKLVMASLTKQSVQVLFQWITLRFLRVEKVTRIQVT